MRTQIKYCRECRDEVQVKYGFCPHCGENLTTEKDTTEEMDTFEEDSDSTVREDLDLENIIK